VCGTRREGAVIVWPNGYRLANRVTYVCGAENFSQSASTLQSGDTGLHLSFDKVWIKREKKALFTRIFRKCQGSWQDVSVCVCVFWWNIMWLDCNKRGCFSVTLTWRIFPVVSISLNIPRCRRITRRPCAASGMFFFLSFFSFWVLQLMLPEALQPYGLLYYPRIGLSNFLY
jgi:hypothetical protein